MMIRRSSSFVVKKKTLHHSVVIQRSAVTAKKRIGRKNESIVIVIRLHLIVRPYMGLVHDPVAQLLFVVKQAQRVCLTRGNHIWTGEILCLLVGHVRDLMMRVSLNCVQSRSIVRMNRFVAAFLV